MKEAAGYCTALHKFLCAHARTAAIGVALLQSGLVELSDVAASQGVVPVGSLSVAAIQVALSTVMGEYDTFYPAAAATSTSRPDQAQQRDHESYALPGSPAAASGAGQAPASSRPARCDADDDSDDDVGMEEYMRQAEGAGCWYFVCRRAGAGLGTSTM